MVAVPITDLSAIPDQDLLPQIQGVVGQNVSILRDVEGIVAGLDNAQFNWRPSPNSWSIAECLEHLNLMNKIYITAIQAAIDKARREKITGDGPFAYGMIGRWFLRLNEPPVKRRFPAPKSFLPPSKLEKDDVMNRFLTQIAEFIELAKAANGLDLARVKVPMGGKSYIRFSLGITFLFAAAHVRRHLWQARNVRNDRAFPRPPQG